MSVCAAYWCHPDPGGWARFGAKSGTHWPAWPELLGFARGVAGAALWRLRRDFGNCWHSGSLDSLDSLDLWKNVVYMCLLIFWLVFQCVLTLKSLKIHGFIHSGVASAPLQGSAQRYLLNGSGSMTSTIFGVEARCGTWVAQNTTKLPKNSCRSCRCTTHQIFHQRRYR